MKTAWFYRRGSAAAPVRSVVWAVSVLLSLRAMGGGHAWAQLVPPGSPLQGIQRPAPPPVAPASPPPAEAVPPSNAGSQSFAVADVTIIGNTAYGADAFAATTSLLTGPAVPLQRIENARAAILSRYRADGYTYATVRARLHEGHLRITITEPRVVAVTLSQDIGPAGVQVLRFLNHLADGRLLRAADLERYVLLANDVPGVTVRALLDPSATDPGALTLRAGVERRAFGGSVTADNRAFREIGPQELLTVADANSFTSFGERSEVSMFHTFNNTNNFGQASEEFFIGGSGLKLKLYGGDGESLPSGALRLLGYDGITRVFGAALSYPVIRARQQNLAVALQFDGIESDIAYAVLGPHARASFDSLRILRLDAQGSMSDIWLGANFGGQTQAGITLSRGLPTFGTLSRANPDAPRLNQSTDFTKVSARLDRVQALFVPFTVNGHPARVQLDVAANGQYTTDVLPPEEKFYLGGAQFTRGFYYGEVTGDRALAARIEPQLVTALPKLPWAGDIVPQATVYGFLDWGQTWEQQATDLNHTLRSVGGGVRMQVGDHLEIDLEGVNRLTRTPNGPPPLGPLLRSSALYWQVVGRF